MKRIILYVLLFVLFLTSILLLREWMAHESSKVGPTEPKVAQEEKELHNEMVEQTKYSPGQELYDPISNMTFVWIPAGCFWMGQSEEEKQLLIQVLGQESYTNNPFSVSELPRHEVCFNEGFWMGQTEATQAQWLKVMENNLSYFGEAEVGKDWQNHPVEHVSLYAVQEFLKKLNIKVGHLTYRLPSEAEWEYACRAQSSRKGSPVKYERGFFFGNDFNQLDEYAWHLFNSGNKTHPVGQLKPNAWGLKDMLGNVSEWCADTWHDYYQGAPIDGSVWEAGALAGALAELHVVRGGSWAEGQLIQLCATRHRMFEIAGSEQTGLRLVRVGDGAHSFGNKENEHKPISTPELGVSPSPEIINQACSINIRTELVLKSLQRTMPDFTFDRLVISSTQPKQEINCLLGVLHHANLPSDRINAAWVLASISVMDTSLQSLIKSLSVKPLITSIKEDEHDMVRAAAADALVHLGSVESLDDLTSIASNHSNPSVRKLAKETIKKINARIDKK